MNLLRIMFNAIKARFTSLVTKFRMFTQKGFILARISSAIRNFFRKIFSVKPRDKDDYYGVFGWLISKKLAFAIVIIVGVLSLLYTYVNYPSLFPGKKGGHIKTYSYNSIMLKFAKGEVRIKGKSGYLAYEGNVSKGKCNGTGTLYNPEGNVVYQGNFKNSMYEDEGTFYYSDGTMHYTGQFHENLFSGAGTLYRENGSLEYKGAFALGMKEGEGTLYDTGHNAVFAGTFTQDEVKYSELLGIGIQDLAQAYTGNVVLYDSGLERVRVMSDIDALTVEKNDGKSVDEGYKVSSVYVLHDYIRIGGKDYSSISDITAEMGNPTYEGISRATLPEVISVNERNKIKETFGGTVAIETEQQYTEYVTVKAYDTEYEVYLVSYSKDGLVYNFVTRDGRNDFAFYYIVQDDLNDLNQ
ncbi:MAG: hypothetical protein IJT72_10780 [Lachnospiraceae bacterium]|nr:hypothetical protein [Lachnospiraceae bacterium]